MIVENLYALLAWSNLRRLLHTFFKLFPIVCQYKKFHEQNKQSLSAITSLTKYVSQRPDAKCSNKNKTTFILYYQKHYMRKQNVLNATSLTEIFRLVR